VTTIAYANGVIAADTLATWGTTRDGFVDKIAKRGPFLAGTSGSIVASQAFLDWFNGGMRGDPPSMPDGDATTFGVIVTPEDLILTWGPRGWERTRNQTVAMGSGGEFAQGAMAMGATPEQAVKVAIQFDTKSGGEVMAFSRL
jgi:ATP-dependent protease HslVU (ClpYQ) peptidase subunit